MSERTFLQKKNYTMNGKNIKQIPEIRKENKKSIQVSQNLVNIFYTNTKFLKNLQQ